MSQLKTYAAPACGLFSMVGVLNPVDGLEFQLMASRFDSRNAAL
jgi:hypothetical protein